MKPSRLTIAAGGITVEVIGAPAEAMDVHQRDALEVRLIEPAEDDATALASLVEWTREQRQLRAG